jgi:hypothetical protein
MAGDCRAEEKGAARFEQAVEERRLRSSAAKDQRKKKKRCRSPE